MRNNKPNPTGIQITMAANLQTWSEAAWRNGIQIDHLDDLETVVVETQNSTYAITIIDGLQGEVVVRGGQFFPQLTPAHLTGASMRGSLLKVRGIYLGFCVEFLHEGKCIITSSVRRIVVSPN